MKRRRRNKNKTATMKKENIEKKKKGIESQEENLKRICPVENLQLHTLTLYRVWN